MKTQKVKMMGLLIAAAILQVLLVQTSMAVVSAEEAKQLGTTLTEFGAEKAGSTDGSIPAYTGGLTKARGEGQSYEDPFKDEKPLFTIDPSNAGQYASQLTNGTNVLFQRFDTYRLDVYPSHRTVRYPLWVLENSVKNATTAKLGGEIMGDAMTGSGEKGMPFPGIPFPIPKNGYEVMWNYWLHIAPPFEWISSLGAIFDAAGNVTRLPDVWHGILHPWYDPSGKIREQTYDAVFGFRAGLTSPPSASGTQFLNLYLPGATDTNQKVWFYTPGQRRVRMAPEFSYDIPVASYGGTILWDEIFGFLGRMDRFDFKLVGKKEMFVPYNVFGLTNQMTLEESFGPRHVNQKAMRWEKHRVWIVEAVRKPTARHSCSKRVYYIDEDSWAILSFESYDNGGGMWRVYYTFLFPTYDLFGVSNDSLACYDLSKGNYFSIMVDRKSPNTWVREYDHLPEIGAASSLTPRSMEAGSVR